MAKKENTNPFAKTEQAPADAPKAVKAQQEQAEIANAAVAPADAPKQVQITDTDVLVSIPRSFRICNDETQQVHKVESGIKKVPKWISEHWYAKAHGVQTVED